MEITTFVDKALIKKGQKNLSNPEKCIGGLALLKALVENPVAGFGYRGWGARYAHAALNGKGVLVHSLDENGNSVDMMELTEPQHITFKIYD